MQPPQLLNGKPRSDSSAARPTPADEDDLDEIDPPKAAWRYGALALPGEKAAEVKAFVEEAAAALAPEGPMEWELARRVGLELWRARRSAYWEAASARARAHGRNDLPKEPLLGIADLLPIPEERWVDCDTGPFEQGCALVERLAELHPGQPVGADVASLVFGECEERCPLPDDKLTPISVDDDNLELVAARLAGVPPTYEADPFDWPGWTVDHVRKLLAGWASQAGMDAGKLRRRVLSGLGDELARRQDLVRDRPDARRRAREERFLSVAMPDPLPFDLLVKYEGTAMRALEKTLNLLLRLQDRRLGRARPGNAGIRQPLKVPPRTNGM